MNNKYMKKSIIVILSTVIAITISIVAILVIKHIYINRTYPETIKSTDVPAGSVWEYEEDGRKLILRKYQVGYVTELKTNAKTNYYELGIFNDAGKYKYSIHISKYSDNRKNTEYVENCRAYFYKESIKLEFDKKPNVFGFSSNEIILKKVLERGEDISNKNGKNINALYDKKIFLSQNCDFGMYKLENEQYVPGTPATRNKTLEGIFENSDGKEEHFYIFGLFSNGNTSTVALRRINGFLYPPFTEEPLDENTYAICDFIDNGNSVTVKIQKSNNSSFKEGTEFVIKAIPIKEYEYSDFLKTIKDAKIYEILDLLKDKSVQN